MKKYKINNTDIVIHTDNYEDNLIESIPQDILDMTDIIHLMPDTHVGKSVPIGSVIPFTDKIHPDVVGIDIGCGVTTVKISKDNMNYKFDERGLRRLDNYIRNNIAPKKIEEPRSTYDRVFKDNWKSILDTLNTYLYADDIYCLDQLGTLGGGNHFIELTEDDNNYYLTVHSGSRYLGQLVHRHYSDMLGFDNLKYTKDRENTISMLKKLGKENEIEQALIYHKSLKHLYERKYLTDDLLEDYLHDVNLCTEYAKSSRLMMLTLMIEFLRKEFKLKSSARTIMETHIDTCHNYVDLENKIIHKGSINAGKGKDVLIPINMRDGMIIGKGKGNP